MEIWKDVIGYERIYQVSNMGRVKSFYHDTIHGQILKLQQLKTGYLMVSLWRDGQRKNKAIHRLVAEAFLSPAPKGYEVNHRNGIKTDNRAENLEWVTRSENKKHASEHGLTAYGEANGSAILTNRKVHQIRKLYGTGDHTQIELGERFGVNRSIISRIVNRKLWQHVA